MEKPPPGSSASQQQPPSTTYVHADATSFREVVQRLTGPMDEARGASVGSPCAPARATRGALRSPSPPSKAGAAPRVAGVKRPPLGLQDRRQCPPRPPLDIPCKPGILQGSAEAGWSSSSTSPGVASPSTRSPLTSPSANMASLSLGGGDTEDSSSAAAAKDQLNAEEEEKAIKEKRFYLHPSPRSGQKKMAEPELLPLFPTSTSAQQGP